jgi:hypothetical protein
MATVTPRARVEHIMLTKEGGEPVLDEQGASSAEVTPLTVVDDQTAPPENFDGDYDLVVEFADGGKFQHSFTAEGINSQSTPRILSPDDCEVVPNDQPASSWEHSIPQRGETFDIQGQHLDLISHAEVLPTSLSVALPITATSFKVGEANPDPTLLQHLGDGPYRVLVTETYTRDLGKLQVTRATWNARAFVIGKQVECD